MARHRTFVREEKYPSYFVNAQEDEISTYAAGFVVTKLNATTIRVPAGVDNDRAAIAVKGLFRWRDSNVDRALAGGAGTYAVFAVAKNNSVSNVPVSDTDTTDYNFDLRIVLNGTEPAIVAGTVDVFRKVATVVWDGANITSITQLVPAIGPHAAQHASGGTDPIAPLSIGAAPLVAPQLTGPAKVTASAVGAIPLVTQGVVGQTGDLLQAQASDATPLFRVTAAGSLVAAGSMTLAGTLTLADGLYSIAAVAGNLELTSASAIIYRQGATRRIALSGEQIQFGSSGDAVIGRTSAGLLTSSRLIVSTADLGVVALLAVMPSNAGNYTFQQKYAVGDANPTFAIFHNGLHSWGAGGASATDVSLGRGVAGALQLTGALNVSTGGLNVSAITTAPAYAANQVSNQAVLQNKLLVGDANPSFVIAGNGTISWGAGGASALDVNLSRSGATAQLTVSHALIVGTSLRVNGSVGFFNNAPATQKTGYGSGAEVVAGVKGALTAASTLNDVITVLSSLVADLRGYGLIGA